MKGNFHVRFLGECGRGNPPALTRLLEGSGRPRHEDTTINAQHEQFMNKLCVSPQTSHESRRKPRSGFGSEASRTMEPSPPVSRGPGH